jgi:outer membrane protein assembly factor BamE
MHRLLISVVFLGMLAGCSGFRIEPHRIDVQQGNALDQESIARLKPGLSRSQVRFLLGTPLVVDPFRPDRWDYVYFFYRAGALTEQRQITLFFDGDSLVRMSGDVPAGMAAEAPPAVPQAPPAVLQAPSAVPQAPSALPVPQAPPAPAPSVAPSAQSPASVAPPAASAPQSATPAAAPANELNLKTETDVSRIKPEVTPEFPDPVPAGSAP